MSFLPALSRGQRYRWYEQSNRNSDQVFHQLTLPVFANPLFLTKFAPTGHRLGGLRCRKLCSRLQCVQRSKPEGIGGTFRLARLKPGAAAWPFKNRHIGLIKNKGALGKPCSAALPNGALASR